MPSRTPGGTRTPSWIHWYKAWVIVECRPILWCRLPHFPQNTTSFVGNTARCLRDETRVASAGGRSHCTVCARQRCLQLQWGGRGVWFVVARSHMLATLWSTVRWRMLRPTGGAPVALPLKMNWTPVFSPRLQTAVGGGWSCSLHSWSTSSVSVHVDIQANVLFNESIYAKWDFRYSRRRVRKWQPSGI
jgi:hypothetical protein